MMRQRGLCDHGSCRARRGQAIVEYLLVTAAVVGAIFWVLGTVQWKTNSVISTALGQIP